MELLKSYQDLISHHIRVVEAAEILKIHNYINQFDLYEIRSQQDDQTAFKKLLEILEAHGCSSGIAKLHKLIRQSYPILSANIPDIKMGLRFKRVLGGFKIVKVSLFNEELAVDIRKYKVSQIFYNKKNPAWHRRIMPLYFTQMM